MPNGTAKIEFTSQGTELVLCCFLDTDVDPFFTQRRHTKNKTLRIRLKKPVGALFLTPATPLACQPKYASAKPAAAITPLHFCAPNLQLF